MDDLNIIKKDNTSFLTKEEDIREWLHKNEIFIYDLIKDEEENYGFIVNVKQDVRLEQKNLDIIPVKFGSIKGSFSVLENNLTNLDWAPHYVYKDFVLSGNKLTSLKGSPKYVGGCFEASHNAITSLVGSPEDVAENIDLRHNQIGSLKGFMSIMHVQGDLRLNGNKLTSLEHGPKEIRGSFFCGNNQLTSLINGPIKIEGAYDCSDNQLTSLEGLAKGGVKTLRCSNNLITSLEGCPEKLNSLNAQNNNILNLDFLPVIRQYVFLDGNESIKQYTGINQYDKLLGAMEISLERDKLSSSLSGFTEKILEHNTAIHKI